MKAIDAADFWQFSLSVYDNEQVQKPCLIGKMIMV